MKAISGEALPKVRSRPFNGDEDFWRIRNLAVETYPITGPGWNWDIRRWDGSRFYDANPAIDPEWAETIRVWDTVDGRLVGAVNGYRVGLFYLQLHPDFRHLEEEMIEWGEEHLYAPLPEGDKHQIRIEVYEYDVPRHRILERRGYEKTPAWDVFRRMYLGERPLPEVQVAEGIVLRPIEHEDLDDCQRLADLLNAAFNRDIHNALEFHQFAKRAPSFRQDLHLAAVAPDGSFTAHVAAIYDEANRRAFYEPVCTHPDHRRKNLAQSLMFECLHRVKALGAREVTVETGSMDAANALYDSIGFTEVYRSYTWRKVF